MKNLIILAALTCSLSAFAATEPTVNQKILNTFNQVFKNAQNVQWSSLAAYTEASFENGSIKTRATLDNNGRLLRTIKYYKEESLPSSILYRVKKKYCDQEVWGVTEMSVGDETTYNIVLKCKKYWYNVKADNNGGLELVSKMRRGDL